MARPRLQALFFVTADGKIIPKARPLHGAERHKIFERDGRACRLCAVKLKMFRCEVDFLGDYSLAHIDHLVPRARGGQNEAGNLRLLCEQCNESRGAGL
jgi:5-methylcytosine-specific restriction endonuclease McrA